MTPRRRNRQHHEAHSRYSRVPPASDAGPSDPAPADKPNSPKPKPHGANAVLFRLWLGVPAWQLIALLAGTLLVFLIYVKTAARSLPTGDSGELISAAWNFGVAHPPGYPTQTILGHLAGLLPIGTPAFRMNLLSVVMDTLAVGILSFGILRYFRAASENYRKNAGQLVPIACAIMGAGVLAISTDFWSYSLVAEVFALNNLLAAIVLVLMIEWVRRPAQRWFLWMSFLFTGLALTNQMTFAMLIPGLLFLLVWGLLNWRKEQMRSVQGRGTSPNRVDPGWQFREIGIGILFFIIGLLPYAYLPIAASTDPVVNWGDPRTLANFWKVVTRANYGTLSFTADTVQGDRFQQLVFLGKYIVSGFTPIGALIGLAGVVWFALRRRAEGIGLALAFLFSGPFFAVFANPNLKDALTQGVFERFYILPSVPFAMFLAAGTAYLIDGASTIGARLKGGHWQRASVSAALVIAIAVPSAIGVARVKTVDMSQDRVAEYYGTDLLTNLQPNSLLLMRSDENYTSVSYLQTVVGVRKDVAAFDVELLKLDSYVSKQRRLYPQVAIPFSKYDEGRTSSLVDLINANLEQRPVYAVGDFKEDLTKTFDKVFVGLAYQLVKKGTGTDSYAILRSESEQLLSLHFPQRAYPATSWEALIAEHYGILAHNIAFSRQQLGAQPDADFVERMYRVAIFNAPADKTAYKNLGLVLWNNNGPPDEIISLFKKYLQMVPDDPEDDNIRAVIKMLGGAP